MTEPTLPDRIQADYTPYDVHPDSLSYMEPDEPGTQEERDKGMLALALAFLGMVVIFLVVWYGLGLF